MTTMENNDEPENQHGVDNFNLLQGQLLSHPLAGEEIVISGISGSFPLTENILEFQENLFGKKIMLKGNSRWEFNHAEIPDATGAVPGADKFDAGFFGIHKRQGNSLDAMGRMVLEKTVEAIFDAGLQPSDLENTKTGVYIGTCFSESEKYSFFDALQSHNFAYTGAVRSMIAHRVSYFLKLKGPSFVSDTACSSSFYAFEPAFRAIRLGEIDTAIVAGANLCLHPFVSLQFARLGVLSKDGVCKVFDEAADGYVRSEVIGVLILQKAKISKRIYAEIIHVKTNCDGFKPTGITFPSKESQFALMKEVYEESGVNPSSLSYLEAHGTGTGIGDPEECGAIDELLTEGRTTPLLIGSVKSNIGHAEPASGIGSIIKCIIAMETGYIPPNICFNTPNKRIQGLLEGRLKVVTEKTPFQDDRGLIGVNSFGFGGGNCHLLMKSYRKNKVNSGKPTDDLPRLVCASARTNEAVVHLLDDLENVKMDVEYIRLLHDVFRKNINNHLYRGFSIVSKSGEVCRLSQRYQIFQVPFYITFGELANWCAIGNDFMGIPIFKATLEKIQNVLSKKRVNIIEAMNKNSLDDRKTYHVLGSAAVQLGLIDVIKALAIIPKFNFGYSYGDILSAYFDEYISLEETVNCLYEINESIKSITAMDSVDEKSGYIKTSHIPSNVSILEDFRLALSSEKTTAIRKLLQENLSNIIKSKATRTNKSQESFATSQYFIEAMSATVSPNFFECLEKNSILLKIGDFPSKSNLEDIKIMHLFSSGQPSYLVDFLKTLGTLYLNGHHPKVASLYPEVKFPVSRGTRMISPHIKWKHDRNWFVPVYNVHQKALAEQRGCRTVKLQITDREWAYADGHVVDGRNLFPATGYLFLVWETLSIMNDMPMNIRDVVFEDCKFLRATSLPAKGYATYNISINHTSGLFEISEGDYPVVTGKISALDENINSLKKNYRYNKDIDSSKLQMKTKDVYKELRLRGYNYKGAFRSIIACNLNATEALIKWEKNWVTFLDNMLQMKILSTDSRLLYVPTYISYLRIPAKAHLSWVLENYINKGIPTNLPVFNNNITNTINCGEVELRGLIASSIPHKKDLGIPVLEKYTFIPNITTLTIEQSIRVNTQILLENALVYKVKVVEIIDEETALEATPLTPIVKAAFEDQPLIQTVIKILTKKSLETDLPVEDKNISEETDNLLVIGSNLLERSKLLKAVLSSLKDNGFVISRESLTFDPDTLQGREDLSVYTLHKTDIETLILLSKTTKSKTPFVLNISDADGFSWVAALKDQLKSKKTDNVLLLSQNCQSSGILGLVNCLRREPGGNNVRCAFLIDEVENFDIASPLYAEQLGKNMAINVYKNGSWGTYRHLLLEGTKGIRSEHAFVNTAVKGDLSTLTWFQGPLAYEQTIPCEKRLVYVFYSALNFRDIMTATGKISSDVITRERIGQDCVQGFEFSGLDSRGDRVMGMLTHGALATLVQSDNYLTFKVPEGMTLKDAATIPVVYSTVIYALLMRGKMKRGDSVLIHSGTGGVGQAAIRTALYHGCEVYTTVGNEAKRDFLKRTFPQLQDCHIGNSHDVSFETTIMRSTKGRGVDLVLNSLAEEKLQTSLRCVARGGRFLEIGKFDLASNNLINLSVLQKEVTFHGIMLDQFLLAPPYLKKQIAKVFKDSLTAGYVKPLDATVFKSDEVEKAFRYMATGKHMGKVLVQLRDDERGYGNSQPLQSSSPCSPRYYCDSQKTYVILGGLGGFGLELADWLILRGAKKLVLTSRSGVKTGYQKNRIKCWQSYGTGIHISQADITTKDGCEKLIDEAQELGEISAIFNLAVVLADALFENQTKEAFITSFAAKSVATTFLDEITRRRCPNLRDFVVFSSVTCGRGNAGQTNYGMSNSVMERICEQRKQDGYPALAIQWGAIGEVGLVAEMQEIDCELEIGGTLQQKISSCLMVLDGFLGNRDATIVSSMVVAEKRGATEKAEDIVQAVLNILGLQSEKSISHHCTLPELGMDSMTAVEMKQVLERDFEVFLSPKDMRTMTLAKLKKIQEEREHGEDEATNRTESNEGLNTFFKISLIEGDQSLSHMHLKSENTISDRKLVIFSGIDGFMKIFDTMVNRLHGEVMGLRYKNDGSCTTIQSMAENLLPVVEEYFLKNDNTFNIIAYSFGSIVALEIAHILESKGYVGSIALVDGSPILFKQTLMDMNCTAPESEKLLQTIILCNLLQLYLSSEEVSQQKEHIYNCGTWEERLDSSIRILGDKSNYDIAQQKLVATGIYDRTKCIINYTPSYVKIKSAVKLFRATTKAFSHPDEDFGLSGICEHPVEVQYIDGGHDTMLDNDALSSAINAWMNEQCEKSN